MNGLASSYLDCTVQVALLASTACACKLFLSKYDTRSHAFLCTIGFALIAALTIIGAARKFDWLQIPTHELVALIQPTSELVGEAGQGTEGVSQVGFHWSLDGLMKRLPINLQRRPQSLNSVSIGLRIAICLSIVIAVVRLILGVLWWQLHTRRSVPVSSRRVLEISREIQSKLAIKQTVRIRTGSVPTAATIGLLYPTILLSRNWSTWTDAELEAVLAHELAHVARRDYRHRLLSQVCVALHVFNPFVHALSRKLHTAQESCADALAANVTNGRTSYAKTLARLALRQDGQNAVPPALFFLPFRSSNLMRRIDMLRSKDGFAQTTSVVVRCVVLSVALTAVAIFVAPLSCLAAPDKPIGIPAVQKDTQTTQHEGETPFDLSHVRTASDGLIGMRFSRLFGFAELQPHSMIVWDAFCDAVDSDGQLESSLKKNNISGIGLDQVEQFIGPIGLGYFPEKETNRHSIACGLSFLRTKHDVDWKTIASILSKDAIKTVVDKEGTTQAKVSHPVFGPNSAVIQLPTTGGIACKASLDQIRTNPTWKDRKPVQEAWPAGWNVVKDADIAIMLDNRDAAWTTAMEDLPNAARGELWEMASIGFTFEKTLHIQLQLSCNDSIAAKELAEKAKSMFEGWIEKRNTGTPLPKTVAREFQKTIDAATIQRSGNEVSIKLNPSFATSDILKLVATSMLGEEEPSQDNIARESNDQPVTR